MIKHLWTLLCLLSTTILLGQVKSLPTASFRNIRVSFGTNHLTGERVKEKEITLSGSVWLIDSIAPNSLGVNRIEYAFLDKFEYLLVDPHTNELKWKRPWSVNKNRIFAKDGFILDVSTEQFASINPETGKANYIKKFRNVAVLEKQDIAVGYELDAENKPAGKMKLMDLNTGKFIGALPIKYSAGLDMFIDGKDSLMYFLGDGTHRIDLKTQEVLSHREVNAEYPKMGLVLTDLMIGFWGTWSYMSSLLSIKSDKVHFLTSNLCFDDGIIYKADANNLYAIDSAGFREIWSSPLNDKQPSFSVISSDSNHIYVISTGTGFYKDLYIKNSNPYFYKISKSGEKMFEIQLDNISRVLNAWTNGHRLTVVTGKKLAIYDIRDGSLIKYITTDMMNIKSFKGMASDSTYIFRNGNYQCIQDVPEFIHMRAIDKIYIFNQDLFLNEKVDERDIFQKIGAYKDHNILFGNNHLYIMRDKKVVIEFEGIKRVSLFGKYLYVIEDGMIFQVDLEKELGV
ncbi:MAG: hypothetical protein KDC49_14675 [Saprospiraceae bacterium]|nr:hypothetical protein [Saprospiraceae bacterium]